MTMYPKLRQDVFFEPIPNGVKLFFGDEQRLLSGQNLYPLLQRLAPLLNGERSLEEIVAPLNPEKGSQVRALVENLHEIHAVRDKASDLEAPRLEPEVRALYAPTLSFLESLSEYATRHFLSFREARIAVVGAGSAMRTLGPALWEAGARHGQVILLGNDEHLGGMRQRLTQHAQLDSRLQWTLEAMPDTTMPDSSDTLSRALRGCDLVVAVGEADLVERLETYCVQLEVTMLPVMYAQSYALVGPFVHPQPRASGIGAGCVKCAQVRIDLRAPRPDTPTAWAFVGARAVLEAFKHLASLSAPCDHRLLRIDANQLVESDHRLIPDGSCERCAAAHHELASITETAWPVVADELVDPFCGLLASVEPEALPQLPICLWAVRFRDASQPPLLSPGGNHQHAKRRGILNGLALTLPEIPPTLSSLEARGADLHTMPWQRSAGIGRAEWIGLGVLAHVRDHLEPLRDGAVLSPTMLEWLLDHDGAFWWKTLQLRYGLDIEAHGVAERTTGAVVMTTSVAGQVLQKAAGRTAAEALKTVILLTLARLQASHDAGHDALPLHSDLLAMRPEPGDDSPTWTRWLQHLEPDRQIGVPSPTHRSLEAEGLYVGWVGLCFQPEPRALIAPPGAQPYAVAAPVRS
jgi:hypothetical protein